MNIHNQCPSCGYTHSQKSVWVDKVVRFQSGKRKGEIKAVDKEEVTLTVGHAPFKATCLVVNITCDRVTKVRVLICPECKTMIYDEDLDDLYDA